MKNKIATMLAAVAVSVSSVKAAEINPISGMPEGTTWQDFIHTMAINPTALGVFVTNLNLSTLAITPGTGVADWLTTPTSANLATALTNETGTGAAVFGTSPSFTTKIIPVSDDGAALGDTTHNFSDLFLATGAVINYANGNVAITHTSGILTMGTGDFRVTTAGTNTASVVTVGGTQTLTGKTLTSPVIGTGLTASGSASNTFAGSTGAFLTSTGLTTISGPLLVGNATTRTGAGAVAVTSSLAKIASTGVADALTLANGTDGQILVIVHDVDSGSAVLTPTTKSGFSTITFTNVGETATLVYTTTRGWVIIGLYLAVAG